MRFQKSTGPLFRGAPCCVSYETPLSLYSACCLLPTCPYMLSAAMLSDWFSGTQNPCTHHPLSPDSNFWNTPRWPWKIIKFQACLQGTIKIEPKYTKKQ